MRYLLLSRKEYYSLLINHMTDETINTMRHMLRLLNIIIINTIKIFFSFFLMNKDFLEHMWRLWPISIIHFPIFYVYIYIYILIWDPLAFSNFGLFKVLKCEHGFNGFFLFFLAFLSNGCFDFSQLGEHCPLSNPILLTKFQLWNQPFDLTFEAIIAVDHISHLILSKSYVCCVFLWIC